MLKASAAKQIETSRTLSISVNLFTSVIDKFELIAQLHIVFLNLGVMVHRSQPHLFGDKEWLKRSHLNEFAWISSKARYALQSQPDAHPEDLCMD